MPEPFKESALFLDLSPRMQVTTVVVASPALAAETVIATLVIAGFGDMTVASGVDVRGWCAVTTGTAGVSLQLRIRQSSLTGTLVADSGATTSTAASLNVRDVLGFDSGAGVDTYELTLQVASATAPSTVSAVYLSATVV